MSGPSPQLAVRLGLLGILTVIVQIAAVGQLDVFGSNADITPLVVASAGLLCGSLTGAGYGFAVGLFVDMALVQTLGVSSLLYLAIGSVRESQHPRTEILPCHVQSCRVASSSTTSAASWAGLSPAPNPAQDRAAHGAGGSDSDTRCGSGRAA